MATETDFDIRQGETWSMGITVLGADGTTPLDITGATITGAVRDRPGNDIAATIICDITDAAAGKIACSISDEDTAKIAGPSSYDKTKTYYYDVKIERADGVGIYLAYGKMSISGGVQVE